MAIIDYAELAQLGEHLPYKQEVSSSSLLFRTIYGLVVKWDNTSLAPRSSGFDSQSGPPYLGVAQLGRASGLGPEGRGFKSHLLDHIGH